ncbi:hypothetical protein [uncultured Apibacter sp.]|uniref:hypothetical protein n=1 Tax=uncultured Apibacter sp. TaxID=1778616 RepID=UPI0025F40673|nr:hypothetical protein [uncultured Apibacter sp.]
MTINKIKIFIFSLLIIIISCTKNKENNTKATQAYQKEGLSIDLPFYWKVKDDYLKEGNRYIELDKYANYSVESTMAISIFKQKLSVDSILNNQINQLRTFYQKVNFKVTNENKFIRLGKFDCISTFYEADDTKNKIYGQVGVIQYENKTITVQIIENKNNADMSDYNFMFNTFIIK